MRIKRAIGRSNLKINVNHIIYLLNIVQILIRENIDTKILNLVRTNALVYSM